VTYLWSKLKIIPWWSWRVHLSPCPVYISPCLNTTHVAGLPKCRFLMKISIFKFPTTYNLLCKSKLNSSFYLKYFRKLFRKTRTPKMFILLCFTNCKFISGFTSCPHYASFLAKFLNFVKIVQKSEFCLKVENRKILEKKTLKAEIINKNS